MVTWREMANCFLFICVVFHTASVGAIGNIYGAGYFSPDQSFPADCLIIPPTEEEKVTAVDCDLLLKFDNDLSINESKAENETILDLFGVNMTALVINNGFNGDIPMKVCEMKLLEHLGLQNNNLTTINPSKCFSGMTQLHSLYLSFNRISHLPNGTFDDLVQLTLLDMSANEIFTLSAEVFNNLGQLNVLRLSSNNITNIADAIFYKRHQISFSSTNDYSTIPQYKITIPLPRNNVDIIRRPDLSLVDLSNSIYNNEPKPPVTLSVHSHAVSYNLTELDMSNNHMSDIPPGSLDALTQLQKLDMSNNQISNLRAGVFDKLVFLNELNLRNNRISDLSTGIFNNLTNLQNLYLSNNCISVLEIHIFSKNLELVTLDLNSNKISGIPVGIFTHLKRLRYLYLSNNRISEIVGNVLGNNLPLEVLDLSYNNISDISRIKLNQIIPIIKILDLSNNAVEFINLKSQLSFSWTLFQNLRKLDLSRNKLVSLDIWPLFIGLFCPGCSIDLSNNNITHFTNSFNDYKGHIFSDTPVQFSMALNLSENAISYISDMIEGWHFNKESETFSSFENKFIKSLKLIINSLKCDCIDSRAIDLIQMGTYNLDVSLVTCSNSSNLKDQTVSEISIDALVCTVQNRCPAKCYCTDQPSTRTIIINCTNAGLTDLPNTLPFLNHTGYNYQLIFSKSRFSRLNYKEYLENTKTIDISSSNIEEIDSRTWKAFQNISEICLSDNKFKTFDRIPLHDLQAKLDIQNNPISCNCANQWLKPWLESMGDKILNPKGILCNEPYWLKNKPVILLQTEEFCSSRPFTLAEVLEMTIIPSVGGLVLIILISVALLRTFRVTIYKYVKIHPFDRDECEGEDMEWDVFLASSSEDEEVSQGLITLLENEGLRVCFHENDFIPGEKIIDNIVNSIEKSKRVLCLLTRNFTKSHYCMEEFRLSLLRNFQKKKRRTVLILNEPIQNFQGDDVAVEVRDYLAMYTCIEMEKVDWKDQLIYKMPINRVSNDVAPKIEQEPVPVHQAIEQLRGDIGMDTVV